jgi:hypothetical protein
VAATKQNQIAHTRAARGHPGLVVRPRTEGPAPVFLGMAHTGTGLQASLAGTRVERVPSAGPKLPQFGDGFRQHGHDCVGDRWQPVWGGDGWLVRPAEEYGGRCVQRFDVVIVTMSSAEVILELARVVDLLVG